MELAGLPPTRRQHIRAPGSELGQEQGKERVGHGGVSGQGQTGLYQEPEGSRVPRLALTDAL